MLLVSMLLFGGAGAGARCAVASPGSLSERVLGRRVGHENLRLVENRAAIPRMMLPRRQRVNRLEKVLGLSLGLALALTQSVDRCLGLWLD